ncbi:MAG: sugar phosphate isomerase/epimerase family protein [Gemmataceae bacterium]
MKPAVTLALDPAFAAGPFVFHGDLAPGVEFACRHGFAAVELFPAGPDALDPAAVRRELGGMPVSAVGTGAGWVIHKLSLTSPDASVRQKAVDFVRRMADFAAALAAPVIVGSMQGRWGDGVSKETALGWLGEALAEIGEYARPQPLLFEPLNRYESNLTNTLADAVGLLTAAGAANVKVLADLFHMNIEEADLPAAVRSAGSAIGHVHLADSNRRAAGLGHTDFPPIGSALREVGYVGYLSAEVFPLPDPDTAAATTLRTLRELAATR